MKSAKWLLGGIGLQLATGYTIGFVVYQVGTVISTGNAGKGFIAGLVAVVAFVVIIAMLCIRGNNKAKAELAAKAAKKKQKIT